MSEQAVDIENAYKKAEEFAASHYENFPVVSFLVKKELRKHVAVIYWFARTADDFSDEGSLTNEERLALLKDFEQRLDDALEGKYRDAFDAALAATIKEKNLSPDYFRSLLKAFRQDVTVKRYKDYNQLYGYCRNSANPVGRLILELYDVRNPEAEALSDNICTALQITNFLQDVSLDIRKGRIYIPQSNWAEAGVNEDDFSSQTANENFRNLIKDECEKTAGLFSDGSPLLQFLKGRIRLEIAWTILGGMEILKKIESQNYDVLAKRPSLSKFDFSKILFRSLFYGG